MNNNLNKDSYYIGYILKDNVNSLNTIQNILDSPKFELDNIKKIEKLHTPLIYLGNMNESLAEQFINYLNNLFMSIIQENDNLKSFYTKLDVIKINKTCAVIMNYENELLKNKIVPFLKKFGTDHIIDSNYLDPILLYIPLVNFTCNNFEETKESILNSIYTPNNNEFLIKSIDIYKKNEYNDLTLISSYPFDNY